MPRRAQIRERRPRRSEGGRSSRPAWNPLLHHRRPSHARRYDTCSLLDGNRPRPSRPLDVSAQKKLLTETKSRIFFLILGAGVTPAEGCVKPTAGFTKNQFLPPISLQPIL